MLLTYFFALNLLLFWRSLLFLLIVIKMLVNTINISSRIQIFLDVPADYILQANSFLVSNLFKPKTLFSIVR